MIDIHVFDCWNTRYSLPVQLWLYLCHYQHSKYTGNKSCRLRGQTSGILSHCKTRLNKVWRRGFKIFIQNLISFTCLISLPIPPRTLSTDSSLLDTSLIVALPFNFKVSGRTSSSGKFPFFQSGAKFFMRKNVIYCLIRWELEKFSRYACHHEGFQALSEVSAVVHRLRSSLGCPSHFGARGQIEWRLWATSAINCNSCLG